MAILARSKVSLWFVFAIVIICRADYVLWRRWLPHDFYENLGSEVYDNIERPYPRALDNNELEYGYLRSDLDFNEGDIETGIVRSIGDIGVNADSGVQGIVGGHSVPSTSDRGSFSEIMSSLLSGAGEGSVSASVYGGGGNSGGAIVSGGNSNAYDGNTIVPQEGNGGISNAQTFVWKGVNGITAPNSLNGGSIFWPKSSGSTSNVNGGNIVVEQGNTSGNIYGDISSLGQGRIIVDNSKNTKFGTNMFWRGSDGIILPIYFSNGNSQGVNGDKVSNSFDGNIVVHPGIVVGQMGNGGINNNGGKTIVTQGTSDNYRGGYIVVHGGKGGISNAHGTTLIIGQGDNVKISNVHGGSFGIQEGNAGTSSKDYSDGTIVGQDGTNGNYKGNGGGIIVGHGGSGSTSANSNGRGIFVMQGGKDGNYNGIGGGIIVGQGGSVSTSTNNNGGSTSTGQGGTVGNYNVNGGGIIVGHGGSIIIGQGGSGDTSKNNNGGGTTTGQGGPDGNYNGNGGGIIVGQGGSGVISTSNNGGGTIVVHDGKGGNSNGNGIGIFVGKGSGVGTSPINYGTIIGHGGSGSTSANIKGGGSMSLHINDEGHSNPYGKPSINIDASQDVNGGYSGGGSVLGQGGSVGTSSIATSTYPYGYHNSKFVWNGVNGPNHQNAYNEAAMFGQNNLVNVGHTLPVITNSGPVMTGGGSTTIVSGGLPGNYGIQGVSGMMGGAGGKGYDGSKIGGSVGINLSGAEMGGSIGGAPGVYGGVLGNGLYGGISANSNEIGGAADITIDGNVASGGGMYGGASSAAVAGGQIGGAIGGYAGGGLGVTYGGGVGGYGFTPVAPASYTYMYGRK